MGNEICSGSARSVVYGINNTFPLFQLESKTNAFYPNQCHYPINLSFMYLLETGIFN